MIRFAIKTLVVLVLVGHAIKFVEPVDPAAASAAQPRFMPASYSEEPAQAEAPLEVADQLSTFTNAQIVASRAAHDAAGFCEREPLACQAGRELLVRMAAGIRDVAAGVADWADKEERVPDEAMAGVDPDTEYRPLEGYRGAYPLLPAKPPARSESF